MVLQFKTFRGANLNQNEQDFITNVFQQFMDDNSFYTTLQILYNNSLHFQSVPNNICSFKQLRHLSRKASSTNQNLTVQGNVHDNYHTSGALVNYSTNQHLLVKDIYIRLKDEETSEMYHILLSTPIIQQPIAFQYLQSYNCDNPNYFIPPTFAF
jgi:hypothetical protein